MSDSEGSGRARSGRDRSGRASSRSSRSSSPSSARSGRARSPSSASSVESFDSFHSDDSPKHRRLSQKPSTIASQHKKYMSKKSHPGSPAPLVKKVQHIFYSINFTDNTITHIGKQGKRTVKQMSVPAREALQSMTDSMTFFENIAYLVNEDNVILGDIDNIFKDLPPKGGSRRRRPSRKYKKSKRVLRKKSRSTRRR